jgi:hypothetical protein
VRSTVLIVPTDKKLKRFEEGIETEKLIEICERQRKTQIFVSERKREFHYQEMGLEARQCGLQVGLPQVSVILKFLLLLR